MRLILVFGLICQSSSIYCRSVKNEENPGQKLAQLLLPLLDDALDPSGDDASLLEVHPYNDGSGGRKKVELTPLNAKGKKEAKPLAIILTSNLADLKKKKERKLRNSVGNEEPFNGSGDTTKEHRIRSNKSYARSSLPKMYLNEKTNKPRNQSRKKYKVPNYKIKVNEKSHYDKTVEKTNEIISDEIDKKKQKNNNKLEKHDFHYIDKTIRNDLKSQEKTMENDVEESDNIVSESDEFENDSNSEISLEKSILDGTGSVNSKETEEKQTHKINKNPIIVQDVSNEEIEQVNHIQKKSNAELSNETKQVKETKEVNSRRTVELVSAEIAQNDSAYVLTGSGDDVSKYVTSKERDYSKENKINKMKESDKMEEVNYGSDRTQEVTKDQDLSKSELRGTVSSEIIENKPHAEEFSKKITSEVNSIEKSELSLEDQSKKNVNELLTAEEAYDVASQLYDVDNSDMIVGLTEEDHVSHEKYSEENKKERSKEIEHLKSSSREVIHTKKVFSGETHKIDLNNYSVEEEKHSAINKRDSSKALDEKSESKINHIVKDAKSISEEKTSEKSIHCKHSYDHQESKTVESVVSSSEESIKQSKNLNKVQKTNDFNTEYSSEAQNSALVKLVIDDVDKKHWVRLRGKPEKIAKKRMNKQSGTRRNADDIWGHSSPEQMYSDGSRTEHNSSPEHNHSNVSEHNQEKSRCHKKHKDEVKMLSRRNNEDENGESDTRNTSKSSNQNNNKNAKVHKSYNLSFKFDKK